MINKERQKVYADLGLPEKIKVSVKQNKKSGVFVAELQEYNIFTEADSFTDIVFMVNDLIFTHFEIPNNLRGKIWYSPPLKKEIEQNPTINPLLFTALTSADTNCKFE